MPDPAELQADDDTGENSPAGKYALLFLAIPVTVVLTLVVLGIVGQPERFGKSYPSAGDPMPPIVAERWINGEGPTSEELAGHVVVLDVWASWCTYCRVDAPELVALHEKYKDQGVIFIGLSTESADFLPDMQAYVTACGFTWPNGYGADLTIDALKIEGIPRIWVVGKDGTIVWDNWLEGTIEEAIRKGLAN